MKNGLNLFVVIIALAISTQSFAQKFGVKGGVICTAFIHLLASKTNTFEINMILKLKKFHTFTPYTAIIINLI